MKVGENQVFNLMDTNGRRNDVISALSGYLSILDYVSNSRGMQWKALPESLAQFEFYRQAIELSPEVFKKHEKFDAILAELEKIPVLMNAVMEGDINWVRSNYQKYKDILEAFDLGAEDRARHYTSNLVKLGFTDGNRNISEVGKMLLGKMSLYKDELEKMLPLNGVNIIYLRQLLKLRVFTNDGKRYYAPFCMALFVLLKKERISQNAFCELVQGINPYKKIEDLGTFVENYQEGQIVEEAAVEVPEELDQTEQLGSQMFQKYFKNRKSASAVKIYYKFYQALYQFQISRSAQDLDVLLTIYESEKSKLNKAFGYGRNLFHIRRGERPDVETFLKLEKESDIFSADLNVKLYQCFLRSKVLDVIKEYSDTTMRIFKATGLISFDNGYVELAFRDLCSVMFDKNKVEQQILGNTEDSYEIYEGRIDSYYCTVHSVAEILKYQPVERKKIVAAIQSEFDGAAVEEITQIVEDRRKQEFKDFAAKAYPKERVEWLLGLFADRQNDGIIKKEVSLDATVPTIYEYIVGLAWYYFSGEKIDLLGSFNLTLSADFEPLSHAGGGMGDIVIYEKDKVIMLEATLMNANSQKRGEWEPVLRHSVNLKIEEEEKSTGREVTTFFIADEFDSNTINIWKAVSSVPLQSSVEKNKFTDNVIIMPINNEELAKLMNKNQEYDTIIKKVRRLFSTDGNSFDREWRDKFIRAVV